MKVAHLLAWPHARPGRLRRILYGIATFATVLALPVLAEMRSVEGGLPLLVALGLWIAALDDRLVDEEERRPLPPPPGAFGV